MYSKYQSNGESHNVGGQRDTVPITENTAKYNISYTLATYEDDRTHSNPGYKYSTTNSLIYTYGWPAEPTDQEAFEKEIEYEEVEEAQRALIRYES